MVIVIYKDSNQPLFRPPISILPSGVGAGLHGFHTCICGASVPPADCQCKANNACYAVPTSKPSSSSSVMPSFAFVV